MTAAVVTTVGLVGIFMAAAINVLIVVGENQYDKTAIGSTMGLVAFSLMLAVAAYESRDQKGTILRVETFDNKTLNITIVIELVLALLIARGGVLSGLLGTVSLSGGQWLIGAAPALLLFVLWELGKLLARRGAKSGHEAAPAKVDPAKSAA